MNSNQYTTGAIKPARMDRLVSVILNGVVLNRMANQHKNNVFSMADSLMSNSSESVKRSIHSDDHSQVAFRLRKEIRRRINTTSVN